MQISSWARVVWALALLGCGQSQTGSEGAGETTAMSGSVGSESSTGESSTGDDDEPMDCGRVTLTSEYIPPVVMYVVDTSSSMLTAWDHDGDPNTPAQSRWASTRELVEWTAELLESPFEPAVVGLQRFPSADACPSATAMTPSCADASACAAAMVPELALAQQDGAALLAVLPGPSPEPVELAGASPAAAAYAGALAHVLAHRSESPRYMMLLTDGRTNCGAGLEPPDSFAVHDEQLRSLIEDAHVEQGIRTLVIAIDESANPQLETGVDSIPDFDPRPALHELGLAGGAAQSPDVGYYSASDPDRIAIALEGPDEIVECVIDLSQTTQGPPTPEQVPLVTWTIDGEPIPYVEPEQCDSQDGWTWIVSEDLPPGRIMTFCGQPCEAMKTQSGITIEGRYGCPSPT